MIPLHDIFSSTARIKVLRVLRHQTKPISLRRIALLSNTPLFSVQRALEQLTQSHLLIKKRVRNRVVFSLNYQHPSFEFLRDVFDLETKTKIREKAQTYSDKAKDVLEFTDSAHAFFERLL